MCLRFYSTSSVYFCDDRINSDENDDENNDESDDESDDDNNDDDENNNNETSFPNFRCTFLWICDQIVQIKIVHVNRKSETRW